MTIDLYQYEDFKKVLEDLFAQKQKEDPKYSQRKLARDAGISNPGMYNDVIKGRRSLSLEASKKMSKALGISLKDYDFFQLLVDFGQAKKADQKEELYNKILFRRSRSSFARIHPELVKYYQDYRYPLVRTSIEASSFKGDYVALANFISPAIPFLDLKRIVRDLCEWDLVRQNDSGLYEVSDKFIEPPPAFNNQVRQLNKVWLTQAGEAIERIPADERHISTLLLSVSDETGKAIKSKMESLRSEVLKMVEEDQNPEKVMQLSLALFDRGSGEK